MEWVGFQKNYVIFKVGHWKLLRPLTRWVGGLEKGQKHAYIIFESSLHTNIQSLISKLSFEQNHWNLFIVLPALWPYKLVSRVR